MASINSVVLVGNLTADPELRYTPGGTAVGEMRIAVNDREKISGEWQERANYFTVVVWGRLAELCAEFLSKGRPVGISGRLRWEEWEAKDGGKRQTVKVWAKDVQFLGSRGDRDERDVPFDDGGQGSFEGDADSDIPF